MFLASDVSDNNTPADFSRRKLRRLEIEMFPLKQINIPQPVSFLNSFSCRSYQSAFCSSSFCSFSSCSSCFSPRSYSAHASRILLSVCWLFLSEGASSPISPLPLAIMMAVELWSEEKVGIHRPALKLITFLWTCLGPYSRPYIRPVSPTLRGSRPPFAAISRHTNMRRLVHVECRPMGARHRLCGPMRGRQLCGDGSFD